MTRLQTLQSTAVFKPFVTSVLAATLDLFLISARLNTQLKL